MVSVSFLLLYRSALGKSALYNGELALESALFFIPTSDYQEQMSLAETIDRDIVASMRAREADKLSVLRMVKTAFKMKEIDKKAPLTDAEAQQILTTLIKQRRDSIEQFTKGNRPELAAKEADEIVVIESYMPKAVGDAEIRPLVIQAIDEIAAAGTRPVAKDMGSVMKAVQAKIQIAGLRADGKLVSEIVRSELAKS
jgi:uncharacterized protein YqeY